MLPTSYGLVANGTTTRARRVLSDAPPFNDLYTFRFTIHMRDLRVSHPSRQILMRAPGLLLAIENGNLTFTTTLVGGGDMTLPLAGATDGEAVLSRFRVHDEGSEFMLMFTKRNGDVVGQTFSSSINNSAISIAGGNGFSIAADNASNTENLQAKIDDARLLRGEFEFLHYGFANNGADATPNAQHLTMENDAYEQTPNTLVLAADGSRLVLSGATPDAGKRIRIYERTQQEDYNYSRPLRDGIAFLPWTTGARTTRTRFFYVVRYYDTATGLDIAQNSNEVGILPALPPAAAGFALVTFDDVFDGDDPLTMGSKPIAGDRYKSQGILLSGQPDNVFVGASDHNHSPYGAVCACSQAPSAANSGIPPADAPLTVSFVVPGTTTPGRTGSVEFFVCSTEPNQLAAWTATAKNSAGATLQTIQGTTDAPVVFTRAQNDIASVVFTPTAHAFDGSGRFEAIDTLRFAIPVAA